MAALNVHLLVCVKGVAGPPSRPDLRPSHSDPRVHVSYQDRLFRPGPVQLLCVLRRRWRGFEMKTVAYIPGLGSQRLLFEVHLNG